VRQHHERRVFGDLLQVLREPLALLFADHERRAVGIIQSRHLAHTLFRSGPATKRPIVVSQNAIEHDEVNAFVIEAVIVLAE
jgi:hypothetical protein